MAFVCPCPHLALMKGSGTGHRENICGRFTTSWELKTKKRTVLDFRIHFTLFYALRCLRPRKCDLNI